MWKAYEIFLFSFDIHILATHVGEVQYEKNKMI